MGLPGFAFKQSAAAEFPKQVSVIAGNTAFNSSISRSTDDRYSLLFLGLAAAFSIHHRLRQQFSFFVVYHMPTISIYGLKIHNPFCCLAQMIEHFVFGFSSLESAEYFFYSKIHNHYTENI